MSNPDHFWMEIIKVDFGLSAEAFGANLETLLEMFVVYKSISLHIGSTKQSRAQNRIQVSMPAGGKPSSELGLAPGEGSSR
jgi:hypothetical protein